MSRKTIRQGSLDHPGQLSKLSILLAVICSALDKTGPMNDRLMGPECVIWYALCHSQMHNVEGHRLSRRRSQNGCSP